MSRVDSPLNNSRSKTKQNKNQGERKKKAFKSAVLKICPVFLSIFITLLIFFRERDEFKNDFFCSHIFFSGGRVIQVRYSER